MRKFADPLNRPDAVIRPATRLPSARRLSHEAQVFSRREHWCGSVCGWGNVDLSEISEGQRRARG
jgi:hypothetical protein